MMFKDLNFNGYCRLLLPYARVECRFNYLCDCCDVCYNIRKNKMETVVDDAFLFDHRDVIPGTPKYGGGNWYKRAVILKPGAMRREGITVNLINQLLFAYGGSGVFAHNLSGMVDGFLLSDRSKEYTFFRNDIYGIPNEDAVRKYYDLYRIKI